ncbi:Protein Y53F4B.11 [Aphelenchoides avenae]|nr:Protein Y53F4B.11 [Aphelenchus avenae]
MSDVVAISELPEAEMLEALSAKPTSFYLALKDLPNPVAKKIHADLTRRMDAAEARAEKVEKMLTDLQREYGSTDDHDRIEILGELYNKGAQGFEISDEHERYRIPYGHRLVLEARLVILINNIFDRLEKIGGEFTKLWGDKYALENERAVLREAIRSYDDTYVEIHERFLKSYLDMEW